MFFAAHMGCKLPHCAVSLSAEDGVHPEVGTVTLPKMSHLYVWVLLVFLELEPSDNVLTFRRRSDPVGMNFP